jgi:uncharacterized membrane protein YfcA
MSTSPGTRLKLLVIGLVAGILSGLLGVGGGIVIVPMLVLVAGFSQHRAHATSLAAVIPIASVAAGTYGFDDSVDLRIAIFIALGALVGAPLGACWMANMSEAKLKVVFGVLLIAMGALLMLA